MLCGRGAERRRIDAVLRRAQQGSGGVIIVSGEPGIGKTALCAEAAGAVTGMTLLSTQGIEAESAIAHAGLFDLLDPLHGYLDELPSPQRAALRAVLRLSADPVPDRLTVGVATLSLLSAAAADRPLLVQVDDLEWVDSASRGALAFAARRLSADPVVFLVSVRDRDEHGLPADEVIELAGLSVPDVVSLLEHCHGAPVHAATAARLVALTGGNPLAVEQLAEHLSGAELRGDVRFDEERVLAQGGHGRFHERVDALPQAVRRALLVSAVSASARSEEIVAALAELRAGRSDLLAAERTGLVVLRTGRVVFHHPLVRAAVLEGSSPQDRRRAHRALASSAVNEAERVWHAAEAAEGADSATADALEALAVEAERVGGHVEAARLWDRAIALTPAADSVAARLLGAGRSRHLAGRSAEALPILDSALDLAEGPSLRLAIQQERGHILVWQAQPDLVYRTFLEEARRHAGEQPLLTASALVLATLGALQTGQLAEADEAAAAAADAGRAVGGLLQTVTAAVHGLTRALRGDFEGEEAMLALEGCAEQALPMAEAVPATLGVLSWSGLMLSMVEAQAAAEDVLSATVGYARERRIVTALPAPLVNWAELRLTTGDWETAAALADEALQLALETGDTGHRVRALVVLGQLAGYRGDDGEATEALTEAVGLAREHHLRSYELDGESALGASALGAGDLPRALGHLVRCGEIAASSGLCHPFYGRFAADLVEVHLRGGDRQAADAALGPFEWSASQTVGNRFAAAAARCRGMLAEDGWQQHFDRALKHHATVAAPFEQARTELSFGERLRRSGQRTRARRHLERALTTFEQLGAEPWATRARDELRTSGGHVPAGSVPAGSVLTPRELRIARAVCLGQTNREVAADLFISPKTVENQLTRIYAKLGVRSRTELAARMLSR